jgi:SAM-dependent methyltransferase
MSEHYTPGHSANAVDFMFRRSAQSHAAFFLPRLRTGMSLLDCGCGPGTITVGLAQRVSPGEVVGIDSGGAQLKHADDLARGTNVNARFVEADVYSLPFSDGEFDGAFSHALFEHLRNPIGALLEIRRVLKPSGIIGVRSPDWGGFVLHPWDSGVENALSDYQRMQQMNGGDVFAGRKLAAWLREAEYVGIETSASYEVYPDPSLIAEYLALQLESQELSGSALILRNWAQNDDAMFAQSWFEAIGQRP